ncbi:hypothetical protein Tco_0529837 [Tanacetum coccineum]
MRDEYLHCISSRDDPFPITKFNYRVNKSSKIATMLIAMNNQPLNYKIYDNFKLKMMGFTKWLELLDIASKRHNATNDQLLKNLKAKFKRYSGGWDAHNLTFPQGITGGSAREGEVDIIKKIFEINKLNLVLIYKILDVSHLPPLRDQPRITINRKGLL